MLKSQNTRIASYNICADFFSDKSPQCKWTVRKTMIYQALKYLNLDIMCVQELSTNQ